MASVGFLCFRLRAGCEYIGSCKGESRASTRVKLLDQALPNSFFVQSGIYMLEYTMFRAERFLQSRTGVPTIDIIANGSVSNNIAIISMPFSQAMFHRGI